MLETWVTKGLALQFSTVTWTRCSFSLPTVNCERFGSMSSARSACTEDAIVLGCYSLITSWWPSSHRWLAGGMGSEVFSDPFRQNYQFKLSLSAVKLTQRTWPYAEQGMLTRSYLPAALKAGKNKKSWRPGSLQHGYRCAAEGSRALPCCE